MKRAKPTRELSSEQLRRLVVDQRSANRQARLEHYQRTGRIDIPAEPILTRTAALDGGTYRTPARRRKRSAFDILLIVIEVAAVFGLVFILFRGWSTLTDLNQQVLSGLEQPTLTPTALIQALVLPSGHLPPDETGITQPNEAEIPRHLQPMVQSLASLPVPTPGSAQAMRLQIPSLGVDAPIVQGDGWEQLKKGVGQHVGSPDPGISGNVVLSAHNDIFGEIFRELDRLKPGDEVILFTSQRAYTYVVTTTKITEPNDVDVMKASANATVTLISCYPYRVDNQRIVVSARLKSEE